MRMDSTETKTFPCSTNWRAISIIPFIIKVPSHSTTKAQFIGCLCLPWQWRRLSLSTLPKPQYWNTCRMNWQCPHFPPHTIIAKQEPSPHHVSKERIRQLSTSTTTIPRPYSNFLPMATNHPGKYYVTNVQIFPHT